MVALAALIQLNSETSFIVVESDLATVSDGHLSKRYLDIERYSV